MSTTDQILSAALHGEALLAAQDASIQPLVERLAALTNGHDNVRLETAGRVAGRWFAAMDSDASHELIAAGLLILAGPFDGDRLAGGLRRGLTETPDPAPWVRCQAVHAYTAVVELATADDADHACQRLEFLTEYHSAITRTDSGRAELILTLPAQRQTPRSRLSQGHRSQADPA